LRFNRRFLCMLAAMSICTAVGFAQAPAGSAPEPKEQIYKGMTLNTSFDGSFDSGSKVFDWTTTTGYVFNQHFSVNAGVPFLFVRGTTATGTSTSSNGVGDAFGQFLLSRRMRRGVAPSKIRQSTPYFVLRKDVDRYLAAFEEFCGIKRGA
jgi:hypothetical protein